MGLFDKLKEGLDKTRKGITVQIDKVLVSFGKIDDDLFEELEEILITSDVGVETTMDIIENLKQKVQQEKITEPGRIKELLKEELLGFLKSSDNAVDLEKELNVIVVLGVNGVGKTTSIGKIANILKQQDKKVIIAAADTFRAAAIEQLEVWATRSGVGIIKNKEGSDPASVVFDAIHATRSRKADVLICDTAGRLHTKKNLMEELKKILRIINRELPDAGKEVLLVLDATTGQNAITQAEKFSEVVDVSGIVLTKLDGTAKGGIVVSICSHLNIPVKFIGVGEQIDDLQQFNSQDFVNALFE